MRATAWLPGVLLTLLAAAAAGAADMRVYFGTIATGPGRGFEVADFDAETGTLGTPRHAIDSPGPSYFVVHPDGLHLYAVNEPGFLSSFRIDPATGGLTLLNQVSSGGKGAAYISLDRDGKRLFAANYSSGNIGVWDVAADSTIGRRTAFRWHTEGQGSPPGDAYSHCIRPDPSGQFVVGADLGFGRLFSYRLQPNTGTLERSDPPALKLPKGAGPRHIVFHPGGKWAYASDEPGSNAIVLGWDAEGGAFTLLQTISTLPAGFRRPNDAAEIELHPNGRFLYVSNRGHDSIAVFAVDAATGKLTAIEQTPTRGKTPRNFAIDPSGRWLLAANQSGNVSIFRIDPASGKLTPRGAPAAIPEPYGVRFVLVR